LLHGLLSALAHFRDQRLAAANANVCHETAAFFVPLQRDHLLLARSGMLTFYATVFAGFIVDQSQ
jgi:hypothetical protein